MIDDYMKLLPWCNDSFTQGGKLFGDVLSAM